MVRNRYGAQQSEQQKKEDKVVDDDENVDTSSQDKEDCQEERVDEWSIASGVSEESSSSSSSSRDASEEQVSMNENASVNAAGPNTNTRNGKINDEPCTFDLRNLLAVNAHPLDIASLYKKNHGEPTAKTTIPRTIAVDEKYLFQKAVVGTNQLLAALWKLPMDRSQSDVGPMVHLPAVDDSRIPRAKPLPPPRSETKWEKFAKEKGIGQNKDKRSRKVFDEATGEWLFRTGFQRANKGDDGNWPILEADANDPYADPWEKYRKAKNARVEKNMEQRMRNQERAGMLAKGTTKRMLKKSVPVGVPVDLQSSGRKGNSDVFALKEKNVAQRGSSNTRQALLATQRSTASLGKFDRMREGEPERKQIKSRKRKQQAIGNHTDRTQLQSETAKSLSVLQSLSSGGVAKEKARKKGHLATGETAYDYDYNDGLGASTFRKKKGRAGIGKMRKMTKKRAK